MIRTRPLKMRIYYNTIYFIKKSHVDLHFKFFFMVSVSLFSALGVFLCPCSAFCTVKRIQVGTSEFFFHPDVAEVLFLLNGLAEPADH